MATRKKATRKDVCPPVIQDICAQKMDQIAKQVADVHDAVNRKVSSSTFWRLITVFGVPLIVVIFAAYAFYVRVPLIYSEKAEMAIQEKRITTIESATQSLSQAVGNLPTSEEVKEIVVKAVRDSKQGIQ